MSSKKNKYPKRKAELSLQFYYDKDKVINFMITSQGGDLSGNTIDFYYFGSEFAESDLFSLQEKESLRSFCVGYIDKLKELKGVTKC